MELVPVEAIKIPTGIRCYRDHNYVMFVYVRSSGGIKKRWILLNGTGVVASDYYSAANGGHMCIAVENDGDKSVPFAVGYRISRAVFVPLGFTVDAHSAGVTTGEIGSTNKSKMY